jgi:hypothetical protein
VPRRAAAAAEVLRKSRREDDGIGSDVVTTYGILTLDSVSTPGAPFAFTTNDVVVVHDENVVAVHHETKGP